MHYHQALKHRPVVARQGQRVSLQLACLRMAGRWTTRGQYRGMSKLAHVLGTHIFDERNSVILELDERSRLKVYLRDGYWVNLLFSGFEYEPEVAFILSRTLRQSNACFVDCGANIGYWSIVASSILSKPGRVWAVEASPPMFLQLIENAVMNDNRFECLNAAVWSCDDETLEVISHDQRHAGSSVVSRRDKVKEPGYQVHEVRTLALDTLTDHCIPADLRIVLKLDVEGAEIGALQGARTMLVKRRPLVIFEDHGNDPESLVSQYMFEELGMDVYYCDLGLSVRRISSIGAIQRIKVDRRRGYNFFACAPESDFAGSLVDLTERQPS